MNFEQILALLMAQFSGVRKDGLTQLARVISLQVTTDDEAKAAVEKLTKAQVDKFISEFRADVDREVSASNQTFENNIRKKYNLVEKTEPGGQGGNGGNGGGQGGNGGGEKTIAEQIQEALGVALKPVTDAIAGINAKTIADTRLAQLNDKLSNCKDANLKAKILKDFARMSFADDNAFNEYLTETETDINTFNQNMTDARLAGQGAPLFSQKGNDGVSSAVANYVNSQKPDADNAFSGKSV